MLGEVRGQSNNRDIFEALIGETVTGCFEDYDGHLIICCGSGYALSLTSFGGKVGPAFAVESPEDVKKRVERRYAEIRSHLAQLRDMPGVPLPGDSEK